MDKVQHFEIPAKDFSLAKKFYSGVFGWQINNASMDGMKYWFIHTGPTDENGMLKQKGFINGGLTEKGKTSKQPLVVITVDDIEITSSLIEKSGGKIAAKKQQIGDMGYYLRFQDPEGNYLGLWQNL